jgi:hypothetical protein
MSLVLVFAPVPANLSRDYLVPYLPDRTICNCEITVVRLLGTISSIVHSYMELLSNEKRECHEQTKVYGCDQDA